MKTLLNGVYTSMMLGLMFMIVRGIYNYKVFSIGLSHVDMALILGFAVWAFIMYVAKDEELV